MSPDLINSVLRLVQPKLSVETITALAECPRRYSDLVRIITMATGETVHPRTLIETLRRLQDNGLLEHPTCDDDPAVYRLTRNGHDLVTLLGHVQAWGEAHTDSLDR